MKKLLSVFMAVTMVAGTMTGITASADDVNKIPFDTFIQSPETYIPSSLRDIDLKVDTDMQVKKSNGSYENGPISVEQSASSAEFDYKAEVDMSSVREAYTNYLAMAKGAIDDSVNHELDNLKISGEIEVTVTYPKDMRVPDAVLEGNDLDGFNNEAKNSFQEISREVTENDDDTATMTIDIAVVDNLTSGTIGNDLETYLPDLTFEAQDIGTRDFDKYIIYGSFTGTTDVTYDDKTLATIHYTSQQKAGGENTDTDATAGTISATVEVEKKDGGGSIIGGGGSGSRPTATPSATPSATPTTSPTTGPTSGPADDDYTLVFDVNGVTTRIPAMNQENEFTVNLDDIEIPEVEGYSFDGWYLDSAYTQEAGDTIDVSQLTTLYAKMVSNSAPEVLNGDEHYAYIMGYEDGTVQPTKAITREEIATIFYRLLKDDARAAIETEQNPFTDVESGRWSNKAIATMAQGGYVTGYENNIFNPGKAITRAEFVTIASRFLGTDAAVADAERFNDVNGHWAEENINKAVAAGWITGDGDGRFRPDDNISRAEAMTIINRMLVRYVNAEGLSADVTIWPDLNSSDWYYYQVIEATNSHEFERAEGTTEETWTKVIENKTWN